MSMDVGGKKGGFNADINVTPMADVMIVLLIIFMVITPMLTRGVDVKLPQAANTKDRKDEPKSIIVAVRKDGTVFLNGVKVDNPDADLTSQIKERLEEVQDKLMYLKGDEGAEYAQIMHVMDLCRAGGVEEVALIADRKVQG
jgi:biopolymer transport protein TolR